MSDAYGFLAPIYQPLSRLVFGRDLIDANRAFSELGRGKKSLIIGGGDGVAYLDWDAEYGGEYWDSSPKMTKLAKHNLSGTKFHVNCGKWPGSGKFDVVFLPFVLDTITEPEIEKIIFQISLCLAPTGKVVVSDFFPPRTFVQSVIQWMMIFGFRIFAGHPRKDLPDISKWMNQAGFSLVNEEIWRKGWIRAQVYEQSKQSMH